MQKQILLMPLSVISLLWLLPLFVIPAEEAPPVSKIDKVFFAQHHVLEPDHPHFTLVGDLETLIKVQVYAKTPVPSPYVFARLTLGERSRELRLRGPAMLPRKPDVDPVLMSHTDADSFTAILPKEWIRSGLSVTVELRDYDYREVGLDDMDFTDAVSRRYIQVLDRRVFDELKVGAPTKLVLHIFDIHFFGRGKGADSPDGWELELACKLPVSALDIRRVKGILFPEIVMPPRAGMPSTTYSSVADYNARTGRDFDLGASIAMQWVRALKAAGGQYPFWRPYHINVGGVHCGGLGGGFRSTGSLHRHGIIIHELGHSFGLPHWASRKEYPYQQTHYGVEQGEPAPPNAGPVWAFDMHRREFISPHRLVDGRLEWKADPMQGGGWSREKNYLFRHFSDYSMVRMRTFFEARTAAWNEDLGQYAKWNPATSDYDTVLENNGLLFPIERDVEIFSLLVNANAAVPDANIIYPLIGPYKGGLIRRFNADSPEDRKLALALGYVKATDNVAIRVTQGANTTSYLLPLTVSPDDDPQKAFLCVAINLPASAGPITRAELLYCPDLMIHGTAGIGRVLYP